MCLLTSITAYQRANSWVMMAEVDGLGLEKGSLRRPTSSDCHWLPRCMKDL